MRCVKIEYVNSDSDLYDLEIDGGNNNYVAEGIVVHNTFACFGYVAQMDDPDFMNGKMFAASKGLMNQGLVFKYNDENRAKNVYVRTMERLFSDQFDQFRKTFHDLIDAGHDFKIYFLGEIYGEGVQDLQYGKKGKHFALFDICIVIGSTKRWCNPESVRKIADNFGFDTVPSIYEGPFSQQELERARDGKDTLSNSHVREGVVVRLMEERTDPSIGRVMLKAVSPKYLLRKGNTTEYT
mgnify:CR=1 FL=1